MKCEAICSEVKTKGKRCTEEATAQRFGRAVCWLHMHAVDNPHRAKPVPFEGGECFCGECVDCENRLAAAASAVAP